MKTILLAISVLLPAFATAQNRVDGSFPKIWSAVAANSPEIKARKLSQEAAEASKQRSARYWLPKLHAEAKAFNTDDPTVHFINVLGERQVTAQDFNTSNLNTPGSHFFTQATVGAELRLYEGGQATAAHESQSKVAEARQLQAADSQLKQYCETVRLYAEVISLTNERDALHDLGAKAEKAIAKYRLGTKANPVGYSGLLALKTFKNKVTALIDAVGFQIEKDKRTLELLTGKTLNAGDWQSTRFIDFLKVYAPAPLNQPPTSLNTKSRFAEADAAKNKIAAERARYLPQLGLFAQDTVYSGERGNSSGYAAGAYLRWNLGGTDVGAAKEARLEAAAAEAEAQANQLNDLIQNESSNASLPTLERTLVALEENQKLLVEQWSVSETLFKSGSLTAHQLSDILSRSVDVTMEKVKTENNYLAARLDLLARSDFDASPEKIGSLK